MSQNILNYIVNMLFEIHEFQSGKDIALKRFLFLNTTYDK